MSGAINDLRKKLIDLCSLLELELDFAEEGIAITDERETNSFFDKAITDIEDLLRSYEYGKLIRDGVKVVLAGSPNVGKSSLLNALLRENRAIVSDIPGTTRDVIEEAILIDEITFRLVDTAGLRNTSDLVEQEGVTRSNDQINSADLILLLVDSSVPLGPAIDTVLSFLKEHEGRVVLILNKTDIRTAEFEYEPLKEFDNVAISCVTTQGLGDLTKKLIHRVLGGFDSNSSSVKIQSERHRHLLQMTKESLISANSAYKNGLGNELVAIDLRGALNCLGEIIGLTTPEDILNNIFSKFCIGK